MNAFEMYVGMLRLFKKYFANCTVYPVYYSDKYCNASRKYAEIMVKHSDDLDYTFILFSQNDYSVAIACLTTLRSALCFSLEELEENLARLSPSMPGSWSPLFLLTAEMLELVGEFVRVESFDLDTFSAHKLHFHFIGGGFSSYNHITVGGHIAQSLVFQGKVLCDSDASPIVFYMGYATKEFCYAEKPLAIFFGFSDSASDSHRLDVSSYSDNERVLYVRERFLNALRGLYHIA